MGNWSLIVPEGATNLIENPSFERSASAGWSDYATGAASGTRTRSSTESKFGAFALRLSKTAGADSDRFGIRATLPVTSEAGEDYVASCWVWISSGTVTLELVKAAGAGAIQSVGASASSPTGEWVQLTTSALTANATGDTLNVYVYITGTPTKIAYVDAVQAYQADHVGTYVDGDQLGCEWNGAEHNSTSTRSAQSRAGGREYDLADDYGFYVETAHGAGMPALASAYDEYALLPGGEMQRQEALVRSFVLAGHFRGSSFSDLHAKRQALLSVLSPHAVPGTQPVRLRYSGAAVEKEIEVFYDAGLEYARRTEDYLVERCAIRLLAVTPTWREIGESAAALDTRDTVVTQCVAVRTSSGWFGLGVASGGATVRALLRHSDGSLYVGGDFTTLDGVAGRDYIARYVPETDTWETVGSASDLNGPVYALAEGPNGDVYVGGDFTNAGGIAAADYLARWDGSSWNAVGTPVSGSAAITGVRALEFGLDGTLYIGGDFTDWAGIANADYIVQWDGSSYSAMGSGANGIVYCLSLHPDGRIGVGGAFTQMNGSTSNRLAAWTPSTSSWYTFSTGANGIVYAMDHRRDGRVYIGGVFTSLEGDAISYIATGRDYEGWAGLGGGLSGGTTMVLAIRVGPDDMVHVGGQFTTAGELTVDGYAVWNGTSWLPADVDFGGTSVTTVRALAMGEPDSWLPTVYDVYVGHNRAGSSYAAGIATVTNDGTARSYPRIEIYRSGGTSATLYSIRNETTGAALWFNYALQDEERLTIDLDPRRLSVTSSFFGARPDAIAAGSAAGRFYLQPGANVISAFVAEAGSPTVEAVAVWRDTYWSLD